MTRQPSTRQPSSNSPLTSTAGDEADTMDAAKADPGKPAYPDLEDPSPAGYGDDGTIDDDSLSTAASTVKTSSSTVQGRSISFVSDGDDDNISISARYPKPSAGVRVICRGSSTEARAGVDGQEWEMDTAREGKLEKEDVQEDQERPDLDEDPALPPTAYGIDENYGHGRGA
ncbi:hypothetical protein GALMADRAFT_452770 [Galerina marginata CBS 339.88]|uniref:Uncharacterized protein n=1 Tax=Galerina marginata (strain CBS 339.88) TaxID=685588 RepID=A0A067T2T4_GALM3|nr:hypothetical protein GALMADRAFT_452770 [Galerina marginata CBS 339.88]